MRTWYSGRAFVRSRTIQNNCLLGAPGGGIVVLTRVIRVKVFVLYGGRVARERLSLRYPRKYLKLVEGRVPRSASGRVRLCKRCQGSFHSQGELGGGVRPQMGVIGRLGDG